jgi:hypothetical protein
MADLDADSSGINKQISPFRWNDRVRLSFKRRTHYNAGQEQRWTVSEGNLTFQAHCLNIMIFIGEWLKFLALQEKITALEKVGKESAIKASTPACKPKLAQ